jgi:hypothetical protein
MNSLFIFILYFKLIESWQLYIVNVKVGLCDPRLCPMWIGQWWCGYENKLGWAEPHSRFHPGFPKIFPYKFHFRSFSILSNLPFEVIFHLRSSSIWGLLPFYVIFIWGHLPYYVIFYLRSSSIWGRLPLDITSNSSNWDHFHLKPICTVKFDDVFQLRFSSFSRLGLFRGRLYSLGGCLHFNSLNRFILSS